MQGIFTKGMQRWFALKGFQVGIPTEDIKQDLGFEDFQSKVENFGKLAMAVGAAVCFFRTRFRSLATKGGKWVGVVGAIGTAISLSDFFIETGATADGLYNALKPYASRSDLSD